MTKYIILIALVAFRIVYHPSPAQTIITPFENTSPVKAANIPAGLNKLVPASGIISTDKVSIDKAAENSKLVTRKFLKFQLVWRQKEYFCNLLPRKNSEITIAKTFTIIAAA